MNELQVGDEVEVFGSGSEYGYTRDGARGTVIERDGPSTRVRFIGSTLYRGGTRGEFQEYPVYTCHLRRVDGSIHRKLAGKITTVQQFLEAVGTPHKAGDLAEGSEDSGGAHYVEDGYHLSRTTIQSGTALYGPLTEETVHKWRDAVRFNTKYYVQPYHNPATRFTALAYPDTFLHVAKKARPDEQPMVAFYADETKAKADVTTRMKLGKYLAKYHPEVDNEEVKQMVAKFEYDFGVAPTVHLSDKEEDFIKAIYEGPSESCMSRAFGFEPAGHKHPAAIYASGDMQIAWIEDGVKVTARTIVNKSTKNYSRIYGDGVKMKPLIDAMGYTQAVGALVGCRIKKIENQNGDGDLVAYVDAGIGSGGGHLFADDITDDDAHWMLNDRSNGISTYAGYESRGVTRAGREVYGSCDCCGDGIECEDDAYYIEYEGRTVCRGCVEADYSWAGTCVRNGRITAHEYLSNDDCSYVESLGEYVHHDCMGDLNLVVVDGEWVSIDDTVQDVDGETCLADDCTACGENADGTMYVQDYYLRTSSSTQKSVYQNDAGDYFHEDSDEIAEWLEAKADWEAWNAEAEDTRGDAPEFDPDQYTLLWDLLEAKRIACEASAAAAKPSREELEEAEVATHPNPPTWSVPCLPLLAGGYEESGASISLRCNTGWCRRTTPDGRTRSRRRRRRGLSWSIGQAREMGGG